MPLGFWAIANWWHAGREVARFYIDLPVWDYCDTITHYARYKAGDLAVLWIQHNEHRIVFPEMIFALDWLAFRGQIVLPTVLSFGFYFGVWMAMVWAFWQDRAVALIPRYAAIFLAAILMAWKGCAVALGIPFLMQWTMNQFFTLWALVFLAKLFESKRGIWLAPLCVCGIVCNYSSGNGLLLWPLLIALALLLGLPLRQILLLAFVGAASVGVYFVGYKPLAPLNWRSLLAHPIYFAKFMASYVSMPFAVLRAEPEFGVRVGLVALLGLLALSALAWRARLFKTVTGTVLFGYSANVLLCGLMTALGRMNPDDPLLQSPKAIRYLTMPLSYWGVLALLTIWVTARYFRFFGTAFAVTIAIGLSLLLFRMSRKPAFDAWYRHWETAFADQQWAALAVESSVLDPVPDGILFPDANFIPRFAPLIRSQHLSLFSKPEPFWIGRDLKAVFPSPAKPPGNGGMLAAERLETAVTVAGWAGAESSFDHTLKLVFVDEGNRIVGLGERLPAGLPERFAKLKVTPAKQWSGFVNLSFHSHTVSPYEVTADGGGLIPLAGSLRIDELK